jgi:hypothetical protein
LEGSLHPRIAIAILLLSFPMAAWADLNETIILQTNSALNFGLMPQSTTASDAAGGKSRPIAAAPADAGQFTVPSYILSALPVGNGGVAPQNAFQLPLRPLDSTSAWRLLASASPAGLLPSNERPARYQPEVTQNNPLCCAYLHPRLRLR